MPEPPEEYTTALANLKTFRTKILQDLVGARVVAGLDASHESMLKYKNLVASLSVTPYVFARVRESALALRLKGLDVGAGEINKIVATYTGGLAEYPMKPPYEVTQRNLPQVDIFRYTPPDLTEISEKTSEEIWGGYFTMQSDRGSLKETPDVQNVFYDYYKLRPIARARVELALTDQELGFTTHVTLKGEATILVRSVTPQIDALIKDYDFYCFLDADFFSVDAKVETVPMALVVTSATALHPEKILMAGGKRLVTNVKGVYAGLVTDGQLVGWSKIAGGYTETVKEVLWATMSKLTISVNDISMGTTDPIPNVYDHMATDEVVVTAHAEMGYGVKYWELDGITYPTNPTFTVKCYVDHALKCIFGEPVLTYLRPNGTVYSHYAVPYPSETELYECVDEEYSDGDATFVYDSRPLWTNWFDTMFGFPNDLVPVGNVPDYVELTVVARNINPFATPVLKLKVCTHGTEYHKDFDLFVGTYESFSFKLTNNPYTGSPWTREEIDDLEAGFHASGMWSGLAYLTDQVRVTQVYVKVPYTPE